jgi:hypothetical protein
LISRSEHEGNAAPPAASGDNGVFSRKPVLASGVLARPRLIGEVENLGRGPQTTGHYESEQRVGHDHRVKNMATADGKARIGLLDLGVIRMDHVS